jgi:hypothetical protein
MALQSLKLFSMHYSKTSSIIILLCLFGISAAEAQAVVTCDSSSPQCCWVVRIWQEMGKTTTVSATSATECCNKLDSENTGSGISGVYCSLDGSVTEIRWSSQSLSGSIPPEIGNLKNLQSL